MSRKKKPEGPPPVSHRACALCGNKGVVEGNPVVHDIGRGPEKFTAMIRCPGPKTWREVEASLAEALKPLPPSGQDRAAGDV